MNLVVVLVAEVDRRLLPSLALVQQFPLSKSRALHVGVDTDAARRLASEWMELGLDWVPLHIEEPAHDSLVESVREVIAREAARYKSVTVLVPELDLGRRWLGLLHRGTGRQIAWALSDIAGVTTAVLPVSLRGRRTRRDQNVAGQLSKSIGGA